MVIRLLQAPREELATPRAGGERGAGEEAAASQGGGAERGCTAEEHARQTTPVPQALTKEKYRGLSPRRSGPERTRCARLLMFTSCSGGKEGVQPRETRGRTYHFRNIRRESFRRQGCSSNIFSLRTSPLL